MKSFSLYNLLILLSLTLGLLGCDIKAISGNFGNKSSSTTESIVIVKPYKASINTPANVEIRALDSKGQIDTSFNGVITLMADGSNESSVQVSVVNGVGTTTITRSTTGTVYLSLQGTESNKLKKDSTQTIEFQTGGLPFEGFGTSGKTQKQTFDAYSTGHDLAKQSDGKIIVAYESSTNYDYEKIDIVRYTANGSKDTSFGDNGVRTITLGGQVSTLRIISLKIQAADDKIVLGGYAHNGSDRDILLVRLLKDGDLDTTFDSDGMVIDDIGSEDDSVTAIALLPDNSIYAAGSTSNGTDSDLFLAHYNEDGTPNTSFDPDGIILYDFGDHEYANALILYEGTHLIMAGRSDDDPNSDSDCSGLVVKVDLSGALDNSFDTDGVLLINSSGSEDRFFDITEMNDASGRLIAAGYRSGNQSTGSPFAAMIDGSDGSLDLGFHGDGIYDPGTPNLTDTRQVIHDATNSHIYLIGKGWASGELNNWSVYRLDESGTLDNSYGSSGRFFPDFFEKHELLNGGLLDQDGHLIVLGTYSLDKIRASKGVIGKVRSDGSGFISSFGNRSGVTIETKLGESNDDPFDIFFLDEENFLIIGAAKGWGDSTYNLFSLKYNLNGLNDSTYGEDGLHTVDRVGNFDTFDFADQIGDGKFFVGGGVYSGSNLCGFVRLSSDGSIDDSFNSGSGLTLVSAENINVCPEFRKDSSGYYYVATGHSQAGDNDMGVLKIDSDGALVTSFNTDGIARFNNPGVDEYIRSLEILPNGKLLLLGNDSSGQIAIRLNADGSIDTSYDGDGKFSLGLSGQVNDSVLLSDGSVLVAGNGPSNQLSVVKLDPSGAIDTTFGTAGYTYWQQGYGLDRANSVLVDEDGKIYLGGETVSDDADDDVVLIRLNADGSLDNSFGTNGVRIFETPNVDEAISVMKIDPQGYIVILGGENFYNGHSEGTFIYRLIP